MQIKFCGASGTVTGSCHLLELDNEFRILLDCGLYQGSDEDYDKFNNEWLFDPSTIDVLILSHAHIDHCGRIPQLVKDGFKGDIICTSATRDLAAILLMDSAFIQESDARYLNKKRKSNQPELEPLYSSEHVKLSLKYFVGIAYDRWYAVKEGVEVQFRDAGHILGSASISIRLRKADGETVTFGFSGDVGRADRPILRDPQPMPRLDYLVMESTYGGKDHKDLQRDKDDFLEIIQQTCVEKKGKLIIPAFSVGRTQELVYMFDQLETEGRMPPVNVYIDSPLGINATDIFMMHPECYDKDLKDYMEVDPNPFGFQRLIFTRAVEESKAINYSDDPCIIISSSGMMQGGRIRHHLKNNVEDSKNTILVVGYCAPGTLGARIRNGAKKIRIFGKEYQVRADVQVLDGLSAHAGHSELLEFTRSFDRAALKQVFLVHGDDDRRYLLKQALEDEGFEQVEVPSLGSVHQLI